MLKLSQLTALFPTEEACQEFLTKHRWPNGVTCPRCGNAKVYALKKRPFHWQCHGCAQKGYRFSLITKTIFENTKYPLRTWFTVAFFMLHSKKGMSALQIKRMVFHDKASYETVWYMCQRIRAAMDNDEFRELMGIVEVDETYIGGKNKNRHGGGRGMMQRTGKRTISRDDKMPVIGAISRKGSVVARAMAADMSEKKPTPEEVAVKVARAFLGATPEKHVGRGVTRKPKHHIENRKRRSENR